MTALTLADFLRARLGEDEEVAQTAIRAGADLVTSWRDVWNGPGMLPVMKARRLLADVEAKRRLLAEYHTPGGDGECGTCYDEHVVTSWDRLCLVAKYLALPFADHPDYDEAWRL